MGYWYECKDLDDKYYRNEAEMARAHGVKGMSPKEALDMSLKVEAGFDIYTESSKFLDKFQSCKYYIVDYHS